MYLFEESDGSVFLCDFHRRQSWLRWLRTKDHNAATETESIIAYLDEIASSESVEEMNTNLDAFRASSHYDNPKLRNWFEKKWLVNKEVIFQHFFDILTSSKYLYNSNSMLI